MKRFGWFVVVFARLIVFQLPEHTVVLCKAKWGGGQLKTW